MIRARAGASAQLPCQECDLCLSYTSSGVVLNELYMSAIVLDYQTLTHSSTRLRYARR